MQTIDPILVSVIDNRFSSICNEIGQTMLRTSRSPIFSEARDFVSAIFDRQGRLIARFKRGGTLCPESNRQPFRRADLSR